MRPYVPLLLIVALLLCFTPGTAGTRQSSSVALEGRFQAAECDEFADSGARSTGRRILLFNTTDGRLLEIANPQDAGRGSVKVGRPVRVTGAIEGNKLRILGLAQLSGARQSLRLQSASSPMQAPLLTTETLGPQKTLVALFNFSDVQTRPFTLDSIKARIQSDPKSLDNFLRENSYGKTSLDVDFIDWKTLAPVSTQICPGSG